MTTWKLSAGTAAVVGKTAVKCDAPPTTAYVMLGERCRNHCSFCAQACSSTGQDNRLSRVTWPAFTAGEAVQDICKAYKEGVLKRVCLQVVDSADGWPLTLAALQQLSADGPKAICASNHIESVEQAEALLAAGAERVCLAMDAATPMLYRTIKGGDWKRQFALLQACAVRFPGKIATHLIIGLGETEEEAVRFLDMCRQLGVTVGLFAFTPVRGTALAERQPPSIGAYRRVQIAHWLIKSGCGIDCFRFEEGRLIDCPHPLAIEGQAFETSGCPDCNRPYYNERPGGVMYNYPRPLSAQEIQQAVAESGLGGEVYAVART